MYVLQQSRGDLLRQLHWSMVSLQGHAAHFEQHLGLHACLTSVGLLFTATCGSISCLQL